MAIEELHSALERIIAATQEDQEWNIHHHAMAKNLLTMTSHYLDIAQEEFGKLLVENHFSDAFTYAAWEVALRTAQEGKEQSLLEEYCQHKGWRESEAAQTYLKGLQSTPLHLWEITSVTPGEAIEVRPYGSDEPSIRVTDSHASQHLSKWNCILSCLITIEENLTILGMTCLTLTPTEPLLLGGYHQRVKEINPSLSSDECHIMAWLISCYHRVHALDPATFLEQSEETYTHTIIT